MPLLYVPLLAAATLVFAPVAMVARSVARGRESLMFARPLRAEIRPRWLTDGRLDISMLVHNRTEQALRIASAVVVSPPGAVLSDPHRAVPRSSGVLLNLVLPGRRGGTASASDWLGLCAQFPRGWSGGPLAVRLTMAAETASGRACTMIVRTKVPNIPAG